MVMLLRLCMHTTLAKCKKTANVSFSCQQSKMMLSVLFNVIDREDKYQLAYLL